MKRILILIVFAFASITAFAQEPAPTSPTKLLTNEFYIKVVSGDTIVYQYKGGIYGWHRVGKYSDLVTKTDKATTITINGVTYDLSSNREWTIPTIDTTSLSARIDAKISYSGGSISDISGLQDSLSNKYSKSDADAKFVPKTTTVNGQALSGNISLDKDDIGLGNVDNTSDASKPISTATQTALNGKQATLVSGSNIKTINGESLLGSGNVTTPSTDTSSLSNRINLKADKVITIATGIGLTGGGNLSANRAISADTTVLRTVANSRSLSQAKTADDLKANVNGSNATGTWPIGISGNAANSNGWNTYSINNSYGSTPDFGWFLAWDSSTANFRAYSANQAKTALGLGSAAYQPTSAFQAALGYTPYNPSSYPVNSGGETLQSVTDRGNSTTTHITIIGPNQSLPTLGSPGGKLSLLGGLAGGQYGLITGILGTGDSYQQVQRIDGDATAYNLLLQPAGGNVGIGTASPFSRLSIKINGGESEGLSLVDGTSPAAAFLYSSVTGENRIGGIASYAFPTLYSGGVERFRIATNGNVGIGTPSPQQKLVVSNSGAEGFEVFIGGDGSMGIQSYDRSSNQYKQLRYTASNHWFENGDVRISTGSDGLDLGTASGNSAKTNLILRSTNASGSTINSYIGNNIYNTNGALELKVNGNVGLEIAPITGNAAFSGTVTALTFIGNLNGTASAAPWSGITGKPTFLSQFTNDLGNYGSWITASALSPYQLSSGLGSNAYTSTAYLPLTGGALSGSTSGASSVLSIFNSSTGYIADFRNASGTVARVDNSGNITGSSFVKWGGTSSQFLKANGGIDNNSYVVANSAITGATKAKITYDSKGLVTAGADLIESDIPALPIAKTTGLQGVLDLKANDNDVVDISNNQTITGSKTLSGYTTLSGGTDIKVPLALTSASYPGSTNLFTIATVSRNVSFPDAAGMLALTSDIPVSSSGTYTPTVTNIYGVTFIIAGNAMYIRSGDIVSVSGSFSGTFSTFSDVEISLPIASTMVAGDLAGVPSGLNITGYLAVPNTPNGKARISVQAGTTGTSLTLAYSFQYKVTP